MALLITRKQGILVLTGSISIPKIREKLYLSKFLKILHFRDIPIFVIATARRNKFITLIIG